MNIESLMTKKVATIGMDDTVKTVSEIFSKVNFHHLLVIEDDSLCGVISDRDLLKTTSPFLNTPNEQTRDLAILKKRAHQIMTRKVITITKDADVEQAVNLMLEKNISCLPVVSPSGAIEGIITWKDIIRTYVKEIKER